MLTDNLQVETQISVMHIVRGREIECDWKFIAYRQRCCPSTNQKSQGKWEAEPRYDVRNDGSMLSADRAFRESLVSEIAIQLSYHKYLTLASQRRYMNLNVNRGDCNEVWHGLTATDSRTM